MNSWPFDQSAITSAITTRQVLDRLSDIRVVIHYKGDGSWAFLCGTTEATLDGKVISMGEAVGLDDSLLEIADLPRGWRAERIDRENKWTRTKNEDA